MLLGGDDIKASKMASQRYHLADDTKKSTLSKRRSPKKEISRTPQRERSVHDIKESYSNSFADEIDTISPRAKPLPPPPGLKNVGNTCYANAALQCLLSTALPHALLDERNAQIIRKHSFNRKLLVYGSGSVDSEDASRDDDADSAYGSCLTGMSTIFDEEDDQVLARAIEDGHNVGRGISSTKYGRKKRSRRIRDDASVFSQSTVHSEMYQVVNNQRGDQSHKGDELSIWLTNELTHMTIDYTKPARKSARASQSGFVGSMFGYGGSSNPTGNRVVDPGSITRKVHVISPTLRPYQQEDAHEFFRTLLSALTMHGRNPRLSSLFDGLLESSVTCQTCKKISLTRDRYMDLSLDIHSENIHTLSDALENFTMDETLDADNKVTCERCKEKRVVTKGLRLATAPTMLVINYKRFTYDMYGRMSRIAKNVSFPLRLVIKDFMSKANRGKPPPYSLVAVLVHKGRTCDRGHYVAYVRKGKDWYLANDEVVTKVHVSEVLSAQAYVLVYEVEGMKEKHNFDCYSRYHKSFDNKGDDVESIEHLRQNGGSMWDFSALSQLLETCAGDGLCGNPSHVVDTATAKSTNSASRHSFDTSDNTSTENGKSKIDNFHLDTKKDDDINRKHYKRGRSYTPSQRSRNREEVDDDDDFKHRSYSASEREERDDYNRRRTRSSSLVENKSRAKEKVTSASTKAPRRKNSDRDSTLPPLQPRNDAPKNDAPRNDPTIENLFQY
mmetsp:Transcript_9461/g.15674  ORF Transcript_9461/g.15674 Transcript_9461/m.15674 type:complete len:728 (+) Transcript_9461:77-2260(+)|eukprot:scaffold10986_cov152-Skeletonema_menzelii.AAC.9